MKNIEVTYDALICENGTYEQGEAAFILPMTDELAAEYLAERATDRAALCDRCVNPHVLKDQDELDDVCAQCPLEKTAG